MLCILFDVFQVNSVCDMFGYLQNYISTLKFYSKSQFYRNNLSCFDKLKFNPNFVKFKPNMY